MIPQSTNPFSGLSPSELQDINCYIYIGSQRKDSVFYPLRHIDEIAATRTVTGIHEGVRIGAAVVLGVLLLLLARTYRSMMFCLYELNFILMVVSSALQLSWIFSFNASITEFVTNGDVPLGNLRLSVVSTLFQMLLIMSLLATLVMQIHVAFSDLRRQVQFSATTVAVVGCFPTYFIWLWRLVLVGIQNLGASHGQDAYGSINNMWVYRGAWPSFAASTSFCSLILCVKLWIVHRRRVSMGVEKFDPIRVLLTMAAQNSVIPAILAIVAASMSPDNFGAQSVSASAVPITAVLLPTGYILAQYNVIKSGQKKSVPSISVGPDHNQRQRFSEPSYEPSYSAYSPTSEVESIEKGFHRGIGIASL